jgi:zinc/manganese transport system ATP-binding protein
LVKLTDASLAFDNRLVWSNLNLEVKPGEFVAVIGANGSGKSMLFKTILGQQRLTGGEVTVNTSRIGYIPQHRAVDAGVPLRAQDLVRFGLDGERPGFGWPSAGKRAQVQRALQSVAAQSLAKTPIGRLSGGELQRVRVAQALISKPDLVLADEPLSALDINHQRIVAELVANRANRESAVLFITHDLNPIIQHVDRVLYLARGRYSIGTPDEVMRSEVLSELYGTQIDVVRNQGRVVVLGAHDHDHHDSEQWS